MDQSVVKEQVKSLYLKGLKRLMWLAMNTPEGVDMFVHWSGHVQWVNVYINHNCPYIAPGEKGYREQDHEPVYKSVVMLDQEHPITEMERVITKCQEVLAELSKTKEVA